MRLRSGIFKSWLGGTFGIDGSYAMVSPDEAVNRYTASPGEVSREYDANGNLRKVTTTAGTREMAYDHGNRMVRFTDEDGNVARYDYDPFGRRVRKITHVNTQAEEETRFVFHGQRVIEERDENNTLGRSFAWGVYIDELVNTRDGTNQDPAVGDDHWYFTDHLYSVVAVVDNEGDLAERYEYSDYGRVAVHAPNGDLREESGVENRTLFTGRELDPESGYYHYRTRTYDPRDGCFTSIDSIGVWGDPANLGNGYAYVGNGPGGRVDPMGMKSNDCNYCGPDVKDAVLRAGRGLIEDFWSWSFTQKYVACWSLLPSGVLLPGGGTASNAWDINELAPNSPPETNGCPSGFCQDTGAVGWGGSCVPHDEVNYYIFGVMYRQCSIWVRSNPVTMIGGQWAIFSLDAMLVYINLARAGEFGKYKWAVAGYTQESNPFNAPTLPKYPLNLCKPCKEKLDNPDFRVRWVGAPKHGGTVN